MSEELLSALLDGECSPDEVKRLLDQAAVSPELSRRWVRLCAAHDALAGTRVRSEVDLCAGVMAAISPSVRSRPAARPAPVKAAPRRRAARWQPWAGFAVAASVAAVAVVGARNWLYEPGAGQGPAAVAAVTPAAASTTEPLETSWAKLDADTGRQLNEYLIEHSSMRADQGMGGLNYARMAVRTADYHSGEPR